MSCGALAPPLALLVGTALALGVVPEAAACTVCTGGDSPEVRQAFLWTTGFLTLLPLGLLGGMVWWLRRRMRRMARDAESRREPSGETAPPSVGALPHSLPR